VLEVVALAIMVLAQTPQVVLLTLAAVVEVLVKELAAHQLLLAKAVLVLSSFHTQAQHNYLVVELLPNQAVTSFTHSHLLAHLALCHLYLQVIW
jgi:hypothetical protein